MLQIRLRASPAIKDIMPSQKVQFFILDTYFLMPIPTDYLVDVRVGESESPKDQGGR